MSPYCTSVCSSCGTLCEAFPITDLTSLQLYSSKGCTIVVGDLYILNLPITITRTMLFNNLKNILYIRGGLYFKDNLYLTAMTFMSNLVFTELTMRTILHLSMRECQRWSRFAIRSLSMDATDYVLLDTQWSAPVRMTVAVLHDAWSIISVFLEMQSWLTCRLWLEYSSVLWQTWPSTLFVSSSFLFPFFSKFKSWLSLQFSGMTTSRLILLSMETGGSM